MYRLLILLMLIPTIALGQYAKEGVVGGTSDSMGVDTDGDGAVDNYLYSTTSMFAMIRESTGIILTVDTDTLYMAATLGTSIDTDEIVDQTIVRADIDSTIGITIGYPSFILLSTEPDSGITTIGSVQAEIEDSLDFYALLTQAGVTKHWIFTIIDPDAVYAIDHEICIDPRTEAALTITRIDVTCDADPTTELDFDLKWADAFIGFANAAVIDELNTTDGVTTITSGFDDATVLANKCIYILFNADPDDAITQVSVNVTWDFD